MKQAFLPILVLVVVVGMAVITTWPSSSLEADHYQRFHDGKSLYALLHSRIKSGDSLQNVEELLGPATLATDNVEELRTEFRENSQTQPEHFPDGVHDEDTFAVYPLADDKVVLQLRNGFVVNHQPSQYLEFRPAGDVAGYQATVGGKH
jgi:hypothetical protein